MKEEKKVVHELKLDKSIIKLFWAFAVVLFLNAIPDETLIPNASAQSGGYSAMTTALRDYFSCIHIRGTAVPNKKIEEIMPNAGVLDLTIMHVPTGVCWE